MRLSTLNIGDLSPDWQTARAQLGDQLDQLVGRITAGWRKDHGTDGSHTSIDATGTISERGRTVPMGEWINPTPLSINFVLNGVGNTITFDLPGDGATYFPVSYTLIGKTMILNIAITSATLTLPSACSALYVTIPDQIRVKATIPGVTNGRIYRGPCDIGDGAGQIAGFVKATAGDTFVTISKHNIANFSAGASYFVGQVTFEIE